MNIYSSKLQIRHWDQEVNVKVFRPSNHLSGHAQTTAPGYWSLQEMYHRLRGSRDQKEHLKKQICLDSQPIDDTFEGIHFTTIGHVRKQ